MVATDVEAPASKEEIPHDHLFKVTGLSSSNLEKTEKEAPADFETAIAATGYGVFNIWLLVATFPAYCSGVSVSSSVSYVFTRAQCDMNLTLLDMGTINASTYGGMITSALLWGYLSDTLGRRSILVWGNLATGLLEVTAAISQNFTMLVVTRFCSGFLFNGPFAVLLSYLAELHRTEQRARVIVFTSLFYTIANTTLPLLAWALLTKKIDIFFFGDFFVIHSWNLFLLATALVPLITAFAFFFMPESPKFLMSRGRNAEALVVFQKIYAMNHRGKSKEDFPYKKLVEEKTEQQAQGVAALMGGWKQIAPLFGRPHGPRLLLMCAIHIGCMFGANTLRLWFPQLAAMIGSNSEQSICSAIAPSNSTGVVEGCQPLQTDLLTYLQSAIVGAGSVLTYTIGGAAINKCGKKLVSGFCGVVSGVLTVLLPLLGTSTLSVVGMMTAMLALTALGGVALSSIMVDLFPTDLRVMAMATFLMCGRLGTIMGTVTFPALINYGCMPPFLTIGFMLAVVAGVACVFVPNTTLKKLE